MLHKILTEQIEWWRWKIGEWEDVICSTTKV